MKKEKKDIMQVRKNHLKNVEEQLNKEFFGIEKQIKDIIDSISAWYICPEIINRPVIINLWGLTGVGKTSVVRRLVNLMGFSPDFLELQMTGNETVTIQESLTDSNIKPGQPGVVLLDEFQRFRTVDAHGDESPNPSKMADIWMLLSDGRFSFEPVFKRMKDIHDSLSSSIDLYKFRIKYHKLSKVVSTPEETEKEYLDKFGHYYTEDELEDEPATLRGNYKEGDVRFLKKYIYQDMESLEISQIKNSVHVEKIQDFLKNHSTPYIDYTKLLIFVSGNLDEAFRVAGDIEDCDTDADVFHKYTSELSIINIKKALLRRFKPEQIARLGNDHIIYPSLSKETYKKLISAQCKLYVDEYMKLSGLKIKFDKKSEDIIYTNSVYPTQGTRPVFSTVQKIFSSPLSRGILWAIEKGFKTVELSLNRGPDVLRVKNKNESFDVPVAFDIENQKKKYSADYTALIAAHEAGHALVYAHLFKESPLEIKSNVASFEGGYNRFDSKAHTKSSLYNSIVVAFGGIVVEDILFGESSTGCASDVAQYTGMASAYVRNYGMGVNTSRVVPGLETSGIKNTDDSDREIESLVRRAKLDAENIVKSKMDVLIRMTEILLDKKEITPEEFKKEFKDDFDFVEVSDDVYVPYLKLFKQKAAELKA